MFLASLGRIVVCYVKDEIRGQPIGVTGGSTKVAGLIAKDEMAEQRVGSTGDLPKVGGVAAKDEIAGVSV
jgi:hypothetical protein